MAPHTPSRSAPPGFSGGRHETGFVPVIRAAEVSPGAMMWVAVDRERVLIANIDGVFYALQDACGHRQAPLSKGTLSGHVLECPLHFARFDVRSGKLLSGPAAADVPVYQVRVEGDTVFIERKGRIEEHHPRAHPSRTPTSPDDRSPTD